MMHHINETLISRTNVTAIRNEVSGLSDNCCPSILSSVPSVLFAADKKSFTPKQTEYFELIMVQVPMNAECG